MHQECGVSLAPRMKARHSLSKVALSRYASAPKNVPFGKVRPLLLFLLSSSSGATTMFLFLQYEMEARMMLA